MAVSRIQDSASRFVLSPDEIKKLQKYLGLPADGMLGPQTLAAAYDRFAEAPANVPDDMLWLLQSAAYATAGDDEPFEWRIPPVWIFYANSPETEQDWVEDLQPGTTIFWIHGRYSRGGAYRRRLRAGDTVLLLVGQAFIAIGILLADERLHFYDEENRVRRPVRVLYRFETPLSREELEAELGKRLIRQGSVHPVPIQALSWVNRHLESLGHSPLPFGAERIQTVLSHRSLADDLAGEASSSGIRPDEETASVIGWTGEFWHPPVDASVSGPLPEGVVNLADHAEDEEDVGDDTQGSDIDVQIPFVLDAPAETEDDLNRGPFALFLAKRLHLIWCQVNGQAPDRDNKRLPAAAADSDTFIAHVDSPWGGGKSTFANFVARVLDPRKERLTPRHFLRSSLAETKPDDQLADVPLHEVFVPPYALGEKPNSEDWAGARLPWIVARYNAWRDQFVQPPWWQIYLTLHGAVTTEVWRDAMADIEAGRRGLSGPGRWLGVYLSRFRYQVWNSKLKVQLGLFAMAIVLMLVLWLTGVTGMVLGSASEGGTSATDPGKIAAWISLTVALLGLAGASIGTLFTALNQSFSPDLEFTSEHKHIGVSDPIQRFRKTFERLLRSTRRPVLLIVDDLDRCEPRTVVEILRGFQTIIRSPRLFVLLLGDRAWIEGAHDIHHKELLALEGGETKLGSLYVRKVIQLSFRLPVMDAESRKRLAKRVLGEADEAMVAQAVPVLVEVEERSREIATGTGSIGQKEAQITKLVEDAEKQLSKLGAPDQAVAAVSNIADTQVVAAAGADTAQQREVFNAITQLVDCLPNNPRQIKRIFMAFATYEQVGRKLFRYSLTASGEQGELRAKRWRQLAMWVTLAVEWPETWRAVARRPEVLEAAYAPDAEWVAKDKQLLESVAKNERAPLPGLLRRLRTDPSLVALLGANSDSGLSADAGNFARTAMEPAAVYEFNRIIWEPGFKLEPEAGAAVAG